MSTSAEMIAAIARIRRSACAILRVRPKAPVTEGATAGPRFDIGFVGSGACIGDGLILTAYHILNNGQPRHPLDKFTALTLTPDNVRSFHCQVVGHPLEHPAHDLAVLQLAHAPDPRFMLEPLAISVEPMPEGTPVVTYGFPAPIISGASVDADGGFMRGDFFLKGHANTGIVSASYDHNGSMNYAFNVDWVHDESGGIVCDLEGIRLFTIMQSYRTIATPTGTMAGPRLGRGFQGVRNELRELVKLPI